MNTMHAPQVDACIDVMKLLCFEMMDMVKGTGAPTLSVSPI